MADIAANADPDRNYTSSDWSSPTTEAIACTSKHLLCHIIGTQHIPFHAYTIATLHKQEYGSRLLESSHSAIPSFVITVACSIWHALVGINLEGDM
eukprot:2910916-Ditylum_brightwellii.AAC.1